MIPIVGALLAQGLPLLANAIMAKGKEWVEEKTGVSIPDTSIVSEEKLVELRQAELNHELEFRKLATEDNRIEAELEKAYLADTQSARNMQLEAIKSDDQFVRRFVYYFATGVGLISALYIFLITFAEVPKENVRFADTIIGFLLGTCLAMVMQYLYGSTRGSQKKDQDREGFIDVLKDMVKKQ